MQIIVDLTGFLKYNPKDFLNRLTSKVVSELTKSDSEKLDFIVYVNKNKPDWIIYGHIWQNFFLKYDNFYIYEIEDGNVIMANINKKVHNLILAQGVAPVATNSPRLISQLVLWKSKQLLHFFISNDWEYKDLQNLKRHNIRFSTLKLIFSIETVINDALRLTIPEIIQARGANPKKQLVNTVLEELPITLTKLKEKLDESLYKSDEKLLKIYLFNLALKRLIRLKRKEGDILILANTKDTNEEVDDNKNGEVLQH